MLHALTLFVALAGASPAAGLQGRPTPALAEAERLGQSGDLRGAIAVLEKEIASSAPSHEARLMLGRFLDLDGRHDAARRHLEEAVTLAPDEARVPALTALGISYAFEARADDAARYYVRAYDARVQAEDPAGAAGLANALGRIYLESGNLQKAEEWYRTGFEMARKIPDAPAAQAALWQMRWHHAEARIAARRGDRQAAERHAASAREALDRTGNEDQRSTYPYLLGYLAFHAGDFRRAADELLRGDQEDPFVLGLLAQAFHKLGDREKAAAYARQVLAAPDHNINAAFARPQARAILR
jgi:tetratricopeptide (TPR) repeat protein